MPLRREPGLVFKPHPADPRKLTCRLKVAAAVLTVAATVGGVETFASVRKRVKSPQSRERMDFTRRVLSRVPRVADPGAANKVRFPAEFEPQSAILVASKAFKHYPDEFFGITQAVRHRVPTILLVDGKSDLTRSLARCLRVGIALRDIRFLEVPHDTAWIRDYGPVVLRRGNSAPFLSDGYYAGGLRSKDDVAPLVLSKQLNLPARSLRLEIDGGNLLGNGNGLAVMVDVTQENPSPHSSPQSMRQSALGAYLASQYGVDQLISLEPLRDEETGHVDMFAAFTSPDTIVVGQFDYSTDPINAAILDRNAQKLAKISTTSRPLKVVRIPMPSHEDGVWRSYTNVVFANGVLLVPYYPSCDRRQFKGVLETYARLLPGWEILTINAERIAKDGGGLHCITRNLAAPVLVPSSLARTGGHGNILLAMTVILLAMTVLFLLKRLLTVDQTARVASPGASGQLRSAIISRARSGRSSMEASSRKPA